MAVSLAGQGQGRAAKKAPNFKGWDDEAVLEAPQKPSCAFLPAFGGWDDEAARATQGMPGYTDAFDKLRLKRGASKDKDESVEKNAPPAAPWEASMPSVQGTHGGVYQFAQAPEDGGSSVISLEAGCSSHSASTTPSSMLASGAQDVTTQPCCGAVGKTGGANLLADSQELPEVSLADWKIGGTPSSMCTAEGRPVRTVVPKFGGWDDHAARASQNGASPRYTDAFGKFKDERLEEKEGTGGVGLGAPEATNHDAPATRKASCYEDGNITSEASAAQGLLGGIANSAAPTNPKPRRVSAQAHPQPSGWNEEAVQKQKSADSRPSPAAAVPKFGGWQYPATSSSDNFTEEFNKLKERRWQNETHQMAFTAMLPSEARGSTSAQASSKNDTMPAPKAKTRGSVDRVDPTLNEPSKTGCFPLFACFQGI